MLTIKEIVVKINQGISYKEAEELITQKIEFHTNAALKAASKQAEMKPYPYNGCPECGRDDMDIDKQSILNAYPKTNII